MPHLEVWQWAIGAPCASSAGVAKKGLPGVAILVVPLMILTVPPHRLHRAGHNGRPPVAQIQKDY